MTDDVELYGFGSGAIIINGGSAYLLEKIPLQGIINPLQNTAWG